MQEHLNIRIKLTHPNARVPTYGSEGAACFDLYAATVNGAEHLGDIVYPGHPVVVDTGLAFEVPEGYMLRIASRSGLAFKHGIDAFPGVIDPDYRGPVKVLLKCWHLDEDAPPMRIEPGDRIAQAYLCAVPRVTFTEVEELRATARGVGGFGSTGGGEVEPKLRLETALTQEDHND